MSSRTRGYQYDAASARLFAAMLSGGGQLSDPRRRIVDLTIRRLKAQGIWDKLDCLYMFAALDSVSALINWKNPGTANASLVSTPSFAANLGYTSTSSAYLSSNFTPSTAGGVYTQDSAHYSVRCLNSLGGNDTLRIVGNVSTTTPRSSFTPLDSTSPGSFIRINSSSTDNTGTTTTTQGHFIVNRSASNALQVYQNAASVATAVQASTGLPTTAVTFGFDPTGGGSAAGFQLASASIGSSLSANDVAAYYAVEVDYMRAVGAV
jgi:hypothetical protein